MNKVLINIFRNDKITVYKKIELSYDCLNFIMWITNTNAFIWMLTVKQTNINIKKSNR